MISQCNPLDTDYQAPTKSSWGYIIWKFWKHRFHQLVHKLKADFYAPYMCVALWTWCCIRRCLGGDQIIALTIHLVAITAVWGHISIKPSSPAIFEVMYLHPYLWRLVASTDKSNLEITWSKAIVCYKIWKAGLQLVRPYHYLKDMVQHSPLSQR